MILQSLVEIAAKAKECGVELFVLDDGWFGARSNDYAGLGDWVANRERLPQGIKGIADRIEEMGMKFGLWFEPEMVNKDSDLYRAHPGFCRHPRGIPVMAETSMCWTSLEKKWWTVFMR